jgi:hypothetical protein
MNTLAEILSSRVRAEVFRLLFFDATAYWQSWTAISGTRRGASRRTGGLASPTTPPSSFCSDAEGYRPAHGGHHYRAIQAMPLVLGDDRQFPVKHRNVIAWYLSQSRNDVNRKRNRFAAPMP